MRRSTPCPSLLVLSVLVFAAPLAAQPALRVKDINPGWNTTWPYDLTASGGRLFFVADDGPHGPELWTSDGTGAGTVRVPGTSGIWDLFPGTSGAFFTKDRSGPADLWKSDGTPGGTSIVKSGVGFVSESASAGALTFFTTGSPEKLWRTDGTAVGTFQILGNDGQELTYVRQLVASNGLLYFFETGSSLVPALWRSDGTAAGTWVLSDATAGAWLEKPLAAFGDRVFFAATDPAFGMELWTSDGTPQGTTRVADIVPGSQGSSPQNLIASGNRLYFTAFEPSKGRELWSTDGSAAGTGIVADIVPGPASSSIGEMAAAGGQLFFENPDNGNGGLWTSDGTEAGTVVLRSGLGPTQLSALGTRLLFVAGGFYADLWTSDGTAAGTRRVKTVCPSGSCSTPRALTVLGDLLFFFAEDGVHGPQLWRSDGTAEGTVLVAVVRPGEASSSPRDFQEIKGTAYFLTSTSYEPGKTSLWASDGSSTGTVPVVTGLSRSSELTATSNRLFWVDDGHLYPPFVLMMSDGTAAGTGPVPFPSELTNVEQPVCTDEKAFFFERTGRGLWVADGTPAGTQWLEEFSAASGTGDLRELVPLAGNVVFRVRPVGGGSEVWRTDGTASGTARVKALSTRFEPECGGARRLGRSVLFLADDGSTGCNVWRSDGTPDGTVPLGVVGAGSSASMNVVGSARGFLVFTNYTELWRSDGTPAGTFLLRSFPAEALAMAPGAGTHEGVYFAVQSNGQPDTTQQLWITDGTVAGTVLLHDFKAGSENSRIASVTTANGRLLASIGDTTVYRPSLWTSDGTPAGTVMVQDQAGASPGGLPFRGVTLFPGTDKWAGTELWAMDGHAFTAPARPTSLFVVTPCRVVDTRDEKGFLGGPALAAGVRRLFPVGGACGIPTTARSIAANVTVTGATSDGLLRIHASDIGAPDATVVSFLAGRTRANNATIGLGPDAEFTIRFEAPYGEAHVIVDVVGWYE